MCDFHSIIIDKAGKVYHLPSNSHSSIALRYELYNVKDIQYWEVELNPLYEEIPPVLVRPRWQDHLEVPRHIEEVAQKHYQKLKFVLTTGELVAPFNQPEYLDVYRNIPEQLRPTLEYVDGLNCYGFTENGYDDDGYDIYGYNEDGYDEDGYDEDGYDACGYDVDGLDVDGYDSEGYDIDGYDYYGYDWEGYDVDGYDEDGYDKEGYNEEGYDHYGYDEDGYNEDGYDEEGYDREGYNEEGINRAGLERFR